MTQIMVLKPYKYHGVWVFDDPQTGLFHEAFVAGADKMIDIAVKDIPDAHNGFTLIFSKDPFPGFYFCLIWRREEMGGNVYYWPDHGVEGWLCPALFKYFKEAPKKIYIKVLAFGDE